MELFVKRAFIFHVVLFSVSFTIVSSATDVKPQQLADGTATGSGSTSSTIISNTKLGNSAQAINNPHETPTVSKDEAAAGRTVTKANETAPAPVKKPDSATESNCTDGSNSTDCLQDNKPLYRQFLDKLEANRDMLFRTMYVLLGVTGIVIIYFIIKTVRLRRRRNKSRKYGVITTRGDVEMEPLGHGDDDDEDYTVFEMNGRPK